MGVAKACCSLMTVPSFWVRKMGQHVPISCSAWRKPVMVRWHSSFRLSLRMAAFSRSSRPIWPMVWDSVTLASGYRSLISRPTCQRWTKSQCNVNDRAPIYNRSLASLVSQSWLHLRSLVFYYLHVYRLSRALFLPPASHIQLTQDKLNWLFVFSVCLFCFVLRSMKKRTSS